MTTLSPDLPGRGGLITLMRPRQWVKNVFVAAPLFFTPEAVTAASAALALAGILVFCAVASAVYVLNDYMDRAADRLHPEKRDRPLAAGSVTPKAALTLAAGLLAGGGLLACLLSLSFAAWLLLYLLLNLAYSLGLKHRSILDVMIIAFGFVIRVEAGASLNSLSPSVWIILMTGLLAMFLALAKRRDDLVRTLNREHRAALDGYNIVYLDVVMAILLACTLVGYLIYTTDVEVMQRLGTERLYYTVPFVVAGLLRYLQIVLVEQRSGAPTQIITKDRFILASGIGWTITFGLLIYG